MDADRFVVVVVLLVAVAAPVTAAVDAAALAPDAHTTGGDPATQSSTPEIRLTQELHHTPDAPGEISVTLRYRIPPDVVDLRSRLPPGATVTATDGFVHRTDSEYDWNRRDDEPSITYRIGVNETSDATGPIAGPGEYTFVDPGPWALVRIPPTATRWSHTAAEPVDLSRRTVVDGPGAVGDRIAFLGDHREITRTAHGQTFRLVVPSDATLAEPPSRLLDAMSSASGTLQVGDRDDDVFAVAAPTDSVRWGVLGLQTGDADMWVRDSERLDSPDSVWLHEYVHTRQAYAAESDARWFTEASASYYAALFALRQGHVDFETFRARLAVGDRSTDRDAVLADPTTWERETVPYTKGALVAGELDRQIRLATDRNRSLQVVFGQLNARSDSVSGTTLRDSVRRTGGDTPAALATRYTTTAAVPSAWDRTAHGEAFDATPARIGYALPAADSDGYRVRGPVRNDTVGADRPIRLAAGETLAVDVRVTNTGGTTGAYDASLLVDGQRRDGATGDLGPGESTTVTLSHRFATPGEYTLTVGGERIDVGVTDPATPVVSALDATHAPRETGAGVTVTATVENPEPIPAAGTLTLVHDGTPVETYAVELAPGTERRVAFPETVVAPGRHVFRVGDRSVVVTVDQGTVEPTPTSTDATPTSTRGDGFGPLPAVVALVVALAVWLRP